MAIHASQGRRTGGSKKNSRRGYGKVAGAASSGAGSQQANAARTAKQGPRGGGTKTGFVKEMDDWRRQSPINAIAAGSMGGEKIAQLKAQSDEIAANKAAKQKAIDTAIASGNRGDWQPTGIGYTTGMGKTFADNVPDAIVDMDKSIYQNLGNQLDKAKPAPESVAKSGGMMSVPPEKTKDIDKEMPSVPADAAEKGAEAAAKKKPKPRPTTWANGTPVGAGTDKKIVHPDSLQARGGGGSTQKNPVAEEDKANTQLAERTPAKKTPTLSSDTGGGRRSSNVTYDYSALDEAREKYAKAEATKGAAAQAAFEGDIGKTMAAGHAIRSLQQQAQAAAMQGPRIRQQQSSFTAPNRKFTIG